MGKASRRKASGSHEGKRTKVEPAPFVARPFEGMTDETEWVAMREILPAATARIRVRAGAGRPTSDAAVDATLATVLPLAWPALHRTDGQVFVATQATGSSGDASRDIAAALLAAVSAEAGTPVATIDRPTAQTPRLQDVLEDGSLEVEMHEGFDFWVDEELEGDARTSLERANESIVPMTRLAALPSAYWARIGERTYLRLVLGEDEDAATDALARLYAAGKAGLGEGIRILGAFRACGLLVPVWELDADVEAEDYEEPLAAWGERYRAALEATEALTAEERRARAGLLSRQLTLR